MISLIQMKYLVDIDTYRHLVTAVEKFFIMVQKMQQEISVDLRLGIIPTISPYLLPLFASTFKQKYPAVHLKVQEVVTERIEEMLKKDLLDAGILVTPLNNSGLIEQPLFYEEMMIYTNMEHPLSTQPIINIGDIATPEMWLLSDGHCFRHQVVNLCKLHDLKSDVLPFEFEGGSLDTMMKIIDKEGGYTLIPELAGLEIESNTMHKVRRFSGITPLREVSLVVNRRFAKTNLLQNLANEIIGAVPPALLNKDRGVVVEWR